MSKNDHQIEPSVGDSIASLRASIESRQHATDELVAASTTHPEDVRSAAAVLADAQRAAELLRADAERAVVAATGEAHRRAGETVAASRVEAASIREAAEEEAYRILAEAHAEADVLRRQAVTEVTLAREALASDQEEWAATQGALLRRIEAIAQAVVASATQSAKEVTGVLEGIPGPRDLAPEPADATNEVTMPDDRPTR